MNACARRENLFETGERRGIVEAFLDALPEVVDVYPAILSMNVASSTSRSVTPSASWVASRTSTRL